MPSFRTLLLSVAAGFIATARADYWVEPSSVPKSTRAAWCADERRTCPIICAQISPGPPLVNDCDPDTFNYGCICSNQKAPNVSEYTLTLPYHLCTEWGTQCVTACGHNNICASNCREQNPCGALDPVLSNATATPSSTPSPTSAPNQIFSDSPNGGGGGTSGGPAAMAIGSAYGLAVVMGGLFAGFAIML